MTEKDLENIALFRYGLIALILNGQVNSQKDYLAEICSKIHQVPYYGSKEFTPKTISCWLLDYRREGSDGLKPKRRSDRGQSRKLGRELEEHLLALRKEERVLPVSVFYDQLVDKGEILPKEVSYTTVYRLLKKHGMIGKEAPNLLEENAFLKPSIIKVSTVFLSLPRTRHVLSTETFLLLNLTYRLYLLQQDYF